MDKPAFLIDVDGVLNPSRRPRHHAGFRRRNFIGVDVWLSARHGHLLLGLADQFDLVWATGWEHDANRYIGPAIGLPELPVIEFSGLPPALPGEHTFGTAGEHIWKLPDVAFAMADRPFAWVDDDFTAADAHWAAERGEQGLPTLLLTCQPGNGLLEAHIEAASAWAAALPARP